MFTKHLYARVLMLATAVAFFVFTATASAQTRLLRFPDISGDRVAFTYGGDIWTAPADGGTAIRLTAHPGMEVFAKFSPDGKWIAFTGQYDGDEQVYVIPATGGVPRQLTFYPAKGPFGSALGLGQSGLRVVERRQAHHLSSRCAIRGRCQLPGCTACR